MASRKGRKLWSGEIPIETREELKQESIDSDIPMWKIVNQALRMYLGLDEGSTEAALERQLEELQIDLRRSREQQQRIENEREELEKRAELVSEQLEAIRDKKDEYGDQLESILESLQSNRNKTVMAYIPQVREAAVEEYGRDTDKNITRVIADLRSKRDKWGYEIPDHQFKRTSPKVKTEEPVAADGSGELDISWSPEGDDQ
ncbi:hypothetical protein [Natronosalvus amylolyticus]|uniref:hypothetical protein n=1 Tax=Natronosalvus amylolyticus TaxID=2961994 RepID=UPI0020C94687|nr:hypothetical protein [Natronosalvus amylolyticus]